MPFLDLVSRHDTSKDYLKELELNRPNAKWVDFLLCRPPAELYNVVEDPWEMHNLANLTHPSEQEVRMLKVRAAARSRVHACVCACTSAWACRSSFLVSSGDVVRLVVDLLSTPRRNAPNESGETLPQVLEDWMMQQGDEDPIGAELLRHA